MGFLGEKNSQRGLHSILSRRLYLGFSCKISNFSLHDLLHDLIRDLVQDPIHHVSRSDPIQSRFCWCHKLKVIVGHSSTFQKSLEVSLGHFKSF